MAINENNTIELLNGSVLKYFSGDNMSTQTIDIETEANCLFENAWFFYRNRERIYTDSRMFLARVPMRNSVGGFHVAMGNSQGQFYGNSNDIATLGGLLEFWERGDKSVCKCEDGRMALIYGVIGNPMTGSCNIYVINEDGTNSSIKSSDMVRRLKEQLKYCKRYLEEAKVADAFTIEQVRNLLVGEHDSSKLNETT